MFDCKFNTVGAGVVQIESIFYDLPYGLMPNKMRALQISYPVIVMEDLRGGDLLHRIDERARMKKPISERYLASTFKSAMIALDSIHKRYYIHRDIKLANMLLVSEADDSPVKLIDFGSLVQVDRASQKVLCNEPYGTPRFMAPETLRPCNKEYSTASDIWQCGCVLYYMLCADAPFNTPSEIKVGAFKTHHTTIPLSAEAKDLLEGLLAVNPADRLSMESILNHPWLGGTAPDIEFSEDYNLRVKKLNIRRKLQDIFEPRRRSSSVSSDPCRSRGGSADLTHSGIPTPFKNTSDSSTDSKGTGVISPLPGFVSTTPLTGSPSGISGSYFAGASGLLGGFVDNISRVCGWTGIDIDAEARYYFTLFDTNNDGWLSREDLHIGITLLITETTAKHLHCFPPPLAEGMCTIPTSTDTVPVPVPISAGSTAKVRLGPNVVTNIDEMFDVIDLDHTEHIDFNKFRTFYAQVLLPSSNNRTPRWRRKNA